MSTKWKLLIIFVMIGLVLSVIHSGSRAEMSFSQIPQYVFKRNDSDPEKPMIALTFDDGPNREVTERILDVLEKYDARATFFVVGDNSSGAEDIIERQIKAGCLIGNHSYSHRMSGNMTDSEMLREFARTDELLKEITGEEAMVARPPFGKNEKRTAQLTKRPVILWSLDTLDWESQDSDEIVNAVYSSARDGDIILMHDIFPSTAEACERLIPGLIKRGYRLVTVTELMEAKEIVLLSGEVYKDAE